MAAISLNQSILESSIEFVRQTLREFPPDRYFIVNWGLSTTLFSAIRREIVGPTSEGVYFAEVPILSQHYFLNVKPYGAQQTPLTREQRRTLFLNLVPQLSDLNGRALVITRSLVGGGQMHSTIPAFLDFARSATPRPIEVNFNFVAGHFYFNAKENYGDHLNTFNMDLGLKRWRYTMIKSSIKARHSEQKSPRLDFRRMTMKRPVYMPNVHDNPNFKYKSNPDGPILQQLVRDYLQETR